MRRRGKTKPEHPTSNIQHPTSNIQHPTSKGEKGFLAEKPQESDLDKPA